MATQEEEKGIRGANFQHVKTLRGHSGAVSGVEYEPMEGKVLISCSADKTVKMWDSDTGSELRTLRGHKGGISDVTWSEDGRFFATGSDDHTVGIWDAERGELIQNLQQHTNFVFSVKFNPAGNMLVSGSFDETIHVWDTRACRSIRQMPAHTDPVTSVDVNHDGTLIASSSFDGLVRIWDVSNGSCLKSIIEDDNSPVSFTRFTPNGRFILIMTLSGRLLLKDPESNETKREYHGHENQHFCLVPAITKMVGHYGGRWLVSGSEDNSIQVWDIQRRRRTKTAEAAPVDVSQKIEGDPQGVNAHSHMVLCVDAHPCERKIAAGSTSPDSTIRIWEDMA
ncbi:hypothetical protein BSKO_02220 [Bryopsis sp. KO-2023]|nr:hypothetical protein BSKO_02220 [Bryopsis sp. KO-2023]